MPPIAPPLVPILDFIMPPMALPTTRRFLPPLPAKRLLGFLTFPAGLGADISGVMSILGAGIAAPFVTSILAIGETFGPAGGILGLARRVGLELAAAALPIALALATAVVALLGVLTFFTAAALSAFCLAVRLATAASVLACVAFLAAAFLAASSFRAVTGLRLSSLITASLSRPPKTGRFFFCGILPPLLLAIIFLRV